jgi:4-diphosphocytidyl-2-C-methyl-D-erythritol kinase
MKKTIKTTSKVNLFLDVLNKREDTYHNIQSLFLEIDLGDVIIIEIDESGSGLRIDSNFNHILSDDNTIYKLWKSLPKRVRTDIGIKVYLEKHIPTGSGLGGGSADAVFFLEGLDEMLGLNLTYEEKFAICRGVGADMPFFIEGGLQYVSGIGDVLKPLMKRNLNKYPCGFELLIIIPKVSISTKEAYLKLNMGKVIDSEKRTENISIINKMAGCIKEKEMELFSDYLYNVFEQYVYKEYPNLLKIKNEVLRRGACGSLLSGTGSAVFGIFDNFTKLRSAQLFFHDKGLLCHRAKPVI